MSEVDRTLRKIKNVREYGDKTSKESKNLEEVEDANYATETRNVTWETETGEIKRDRTTRTEKRKVRKRGD